MKKKLSPFEEKLNTWVANHFSRIPFVQKIFFVEHLRTMIHAGISVVEALDILQKESENRKMNGIIAHVKLEVEQGKQLSEVLLAYPDLFPAVYIKMVAAGEISGKLEESLLQIETQMKKTRELTSSIRGAMVYPTVVIAAMFVVGILMVTVVLPKLLVLFKEFDTELPLATRILIAITDFMSNPINLTIMGVAFVLCVIGYIIGLKKSHSFRQGVHWVLLHLPIVGGVIREINVARFSLTLSSLLNSAIPIIDAIDITADTCGNIHYKEALHNTTEKIKTGVALSDTLREYPFLFPPIVTEMIMVGERSGDVGNLLTELSHFYGDQVDKTMKNFSTIIEPVIILMLGVAVGGLAVAVIMPMYTLVQTF